MDRSMIGLKWGRGGCGSAARAREWNVVYDNADRMDADIMIDG